MIKKFFIFFPIASSLLWGCLPTDYEHLPQSNEYIVDKLWGCDLQIRTDGNTKNISNLLYNCSKKKNLKGLSRDLEVILGKTDLVSNEIVTLSIKADDIYFPRLLSGINESLSWPNDFVEKFKTEIQTAFSDDSSIKEIELKYDAIVKRDEGIEHHMNVGEYVELQKRISALQVYSQDLQNEIISTYLDGFTPVLTKIGCNNPRPLMGEIGVLYTGEHHGEFPEAYEPSYLIKKGVFQSATKENYPLITKLSLSCD